MKSTDWAYFAGLFDGDGCVFAHNTSRNCVTYGVTLTNIDPRPLLTLQEIFGGQLRSTGARKFQRGDNESVERTLYRWVAGHRKAVPFAEGIVGYSVIKKEQLELLIVLSSLIVPGRTQSLSVDEIQRRDSVIDLIADEKKASWSLT
jgi:hypothetical protein